MNIAKLLTPRNIALAEELGASVKSSPTMMTLVNDLDGMSANEAYLRLKNLSDKELRVLATTIGRANTALKRKGAS